MTKTETEYVIPPAAVMPDCPQFLWTGDTIGSRIEDSEVLMGEYMKCRYEIDQLEFWLNERKSK